MEVRPTMLGLPATIRLAMSSNWRCVSAYVPIYTNVMLCSFFELQAQNFTWQLLRGVLLEDFIWGNMGDVSDQALQESKGNCTTCLHHSDFNQVGVTEIRKKEINATLVSGCCPRAAEVLLLCCYQSFSDCFIFFLNELPYPVSSQYSRNCLVLPSALCLSATFPFCTA